jgi:hypothetical protein
VLNPVSDPDPTNPKGSITLLLSKFQDYESICYRKETISRDFKHYCSYINSFSAFSKYVEGRDTLRTTMSLKEGPKKKKFRSRGRALLLGVYKSI